MIRRLQSFMYPSFRQAAMVSRKRTQRNHRPESLQQYLYVLLACGDKEMFDRECEAAGKSKEEKKALCEAWEQACSTAGNDSDEVWYQPRCARDKRIAGRAIAKIRRNQTL